MKIETLFNQAAKHYDSARKLLIPCFDDFYSTAVEVIPFTKTDHIKVLDLGAGTGLFSYMVNQNYPNADFTLIDLSEKMLEEAQTRFVNTKTKIEYLTMNYVEQPLPGKFDLIISALSIHHLTSQEKQKLFSDIYRHLNNGGIFINADQVLGETEAIENIYKKSWLNSVKNSGVAKVTLDAALERMKEDKMSTLKDQLHWLKNNNFRDINCWYKNYSFVVYSAKKE